MAADNTDVPERLAELRRRAGLSLRELSRRCGVTVAMISAIEKGKHSPTITTLAKVLAGLGSDLASFFGRSEESAAGPVFLREHMKSVADAGRTYTILLPAGRRFHVEMLDEEIRPTPSDATVETLQTDVAGYVLSGELTLQISDRPAARVRAGDAFYIPAGTPHRGFASSREPVRLLTVYSPRRY